MEHEYFSSTSYVLVAQSCPTLCDPIDCSSSVHGISQAKIQEWVAMPFSRETSWPRDQTWVSWTAGGLFTIWATKDTKNEMLIALEIKATYIFCRNG